MDWNWKWRLGISGEFYTLAWAFMLSFVSTCFLIVSWSTSYWINGAAIQGGLGKPTGGVIHTHYGLFHGTTVGETLTKNYTRSLKMTCVFSENICAQSCQPTSGDRRDELISLLEGKPVARNCDGLPVTVGTEKVKANVERRRSLFIKPGLLITTIIFLALATICNLLATISIVVSMTEYPPIYFLFRMPMLLFWNIGCSVSCATCVLLWIIQIGLLGDNLAVQETLHADKIFVFDFHSHISPGFAFYGLICVFLMHFVNVNMIGLDVGTSAVFVDAPPVETVVI